MNKSDRLVWRNDQPPAFTGGQPSFTDPPGQGKSEQRPSPMALAFADLQTETDELHKALERPVRRLDPVMVVRIETDQAVSAPKPERSMAVSAIEASSLSVANARRIVQQLTRLVDV